MKKLIIFLFMFAIANVYGQHVERITTPREVNLTNAALAPPVVVFTGSFSGTTFAANGWTTIGTPSGRNWERTNLSGLSGNRPGVTSANHARITQHNTVSHNAWLMSQGFMLEQGKTYTIRFWLYMAGTAAVSEKLAVKIGTAATTEAMTETLFVNETENYFAWTQITVNYTAQESTNHHLGFHAYTSNGGTTTTISVAPTASGIALNDILVVETPENELQVETLFPTNLRPRYYNLQVSTNQSLPSVRVKNTGLATQNNIVLTAELNGVPIGVSAPYASLAPLVSADLNLTSAVNFQEGVNTITYKISRDGKTETIDHAFTVTGTQNTFAADNAFTTGSQYGHTVASIYGNIIEITDTVTLSQVMLDFFTTVNIAFAYDIRVHRLTDDFKIDPTPLLDHAASRSGTGLVIVTVPTTVLTPGRYLLGVNQRTATSLGFRHDGNTARSVVATNEVVNWTLIPRQTALNSGAIAIRMVTLVDDCPVPANVVVARGVNSVTLSWEGNALRYRVTVTSDDGTVTRSTTTANNTWTATGLTEATAHTYSVAALCDGYNEGTATGAFSTLADCKVITEYPFIEGFETSGTNIPDCWTHERITGTTDWVVVAGNTSIPNTAHGGAYKARFSTTFATRGHMARLITPQLDLTGVSDPVLNFWHAQAKWDNEQDTLWIYYKTSAAGEWVHLRTFSQDFQTWHKHQIDLPDASNDYYIAFVARGQVGRGVMLDDIMIGSKNMPTDGYDLRNVTTYPYAKVPASQILPPAKVENVGFLTVTNAILSVELNGTPAGTSAAHPALIPGASTELSLTSAVSVPLGQNIMTYTITQDQTDDTPENNVRTFTYEGTQSVFAVDNIVDFSTGLGSIAPVTFGHIYTITQPITISQVIVGHGNPALMSMSPLDYSVSLYAMTDDNTTASTPIFTQQTRRRSDIGFSVITVPATLLMPGSYYLCVNQLTDVGVLVSFDSDLSRRPYIRESTGSLSQLSATFNIGALAIRMVVETPACVVAQPTNLTAVPDYTSVDLSWDGTAPVYFLVTLNDGTQDHKFITMNNSLTISNLLVGTSFTWKVSAMCDALYGVESIEMSFSTLNCNSINTFPYEESFENNGTNFPTCWLQEQVVGTASWTVVPASTGTPATAHDGNYKAYFISAIDNANAVVKLVTPPFDLSGLTKPRLSFWHTQARQGLAQDVLKVYYKTSKNGTWTQLATYSEDISDWREELIELPNASNEYYIAFEAQRSVYGYGFGIQLDAIHIIDFDHVIDGEIAQIITPKAGINYSLTSSEQVKVLIKNNGSEPLSSFDLKLELDGIEIATETYTSSIASMDQAEYTFDTTLNLSAAGNYEITVTIIAAGDTVSENDSKTITVNNIICSPVTTFPFTEGFEGDLFPPLCWTSHNLAPVQGTQNWERATNLRYSGVASARHRFDGQTRDGWLVMPAIQIPNSGNIVLEFWSYNEFHADNVHSGIWISTTSGNPTTRGAFTLVKELKGASEISASWKKISIPLSSDYAGQTIYIGFRYRGSNADNWYIDDVSVLNLGDVIDGELVSIITPNSGEGLTHNESVKIAIKNNGNNPLTGFNLKLELNGTEVANEPYTGTIASTAQVEYTFGHELNLSAIASYEIRVTLLIAGDQVPDNNTKTKRIGHFASDVVTLSGYRIFDVNLSDDAARGFVSFKSNNPENVTRENDYTPPAPASNMHAGEYLDSVFYAYSVSSTGQPVGFLKISTTDWTQISSTSISNYPDDMAYDHTTGIMYGVFREMFVSSRLVRINMETGAMTQVGELGRGAVALACDEQGRLFIIDHLGNLCSVNKSTGATIIIGSTGIQPYYTQSMAFDQNTGRLFWAMCNIGGDQGRLVEIMPASGVAFDRGAIAGEAEIIGLFTRKKDSEAYTITLSANPAEGGSVSGAGTYDEGDLVEVTATPNTNYIFVNWMENGTAVSTTATFTFTVTRDRTLVANFDLTTSIQITDNQDLFTVYPNPVNDVLHIKTEQTIKQISVLDLNGKVMMQLQGDRKIVDLQSVPSGNYIVRIHTETAIVPIKIVKQ
ncbi:MAG: choice-of-anchor J domain-containing protein [Bacteroidales bacterium]|jgi:hypothetical protein|nr:choice-of-anchor J domain-containing protein [Bacteroidales bacterium]